MAINLLDITSNNNDLTNSGAAEVTTSLPFAQSTIAVDLEATESDYLYAGDSTSLSITGDMTVECWAKFESLPANAAYMALVAKNGAAAPNRGYRFYVYNNAGEYWLAFSYSDNGTNQDTHYKVITPSTGTWYHYAAAVDVSAHSVEFFVNGSSLTADATGTRTSIYDSNSEFWIGADNDASSYFDGVIDDVRVWNDIRTVTELANNKDVELVGNEANLVAYWPFETDLGVSSNFLGIL